MNDPTPEATAPQPVPPARKRVHVETWGCQMNVADSESMLSMLGQSDYMKTEDPSDADLIILNTCHIREKAVHKVISRLGTLKALKKANPGLQIAVSGCVPQMEHKRIAKSAPFVDVMLGPGQIQSLPGLLQENRSTGKPAFAFGFDPPAASAPAPAEAKVQEPAKRPVLDGKNAVSRFINIAQGCDNFCTFCVVPFTRGREVSRLSAEILSEAEALVAGGAKEIVLLGQNVNSYGADLVERGLTAATEKGPFVELLEAVEALPGLERLRFTTSNPHDFTLPIARLYGSSRKLGRYLHLPVQSGSDRVLEVMKRKVTAAGYLDRIRMLRSFVHDIALSTDIIVGFPGETEEEFEMTMAMVREVEYHFIYAFAYSPRRGTAAARFKDQVPEEVKTKRLRQLNEAQAGISQSLHERAVGAEVSVLFHYPSAKEANAYYGRDEYFRLVKVTSPRSVVGETRMVRIDKASKTSLTGTVL